MVTRRLIAPPAAARQAVLVGARLIHAVAGIFFCHHLAQIVVEVLGRVGLVGSTPQCYRRMIAQSAHFVEGIGFEGFGLCHIVVCHIEPKVVPNHYAIAVAIVVKFIVGDAPGPQAYHIVIHLLMQFYLFLIFFALATKQIFAHTPVSAFEEEFLTIDKEGHHGVAHFVVHHLIFILLDSKGHLALVEHFAAFFHL